MIFFLISGFVILLSLEKLNLKQFIVQRIFRIYPVWIFGLCLYYSYAGGWSFFGTYAPLFIRDFFTCLGEIPVPLWTLEIEVVFYLIVGLIVLFFKQIKIKHLLWFAFIQFVIVAFAIWHLKSHGEVIEGNATFIRLLIAYKICTTSHVALSYGLLKHLPFIAYMFIGSVVYFHYRKKINDIQMLIFICTLLFSSQVFYLYPHSDNINFPKDILLTTLLFLCLYLQKDNIKISKPVIFFANISYPMYIVHQPIKELALKLAPLISGHQKMMFLFVITIPVTIIFSYIIHIFLEKPIINFSKKYTFEKICKT